MKNFAEQKDWGRDKQSKQFIFREIKYNKPYPFPDNFFDAISLKMVIHHIKNIDFTLNEIKRILKKNGLLIMIEHDGFTPIDYMLFDIEHGLYINVYNDDSLTEEFSKLSKDTKKPDLGFIKYRDWVEYDNLFNKYGFEYKSASLFSEHIYSDILPSRIMSAYYTLNK
jgi:ubiquinone/menaquinone biosynthesis C-methylase UbiE